MAKRIYAPGELDNVKKRLGNISEKEAKRMQSLLGGEVGYERNTGSVTDDDRGRRRAGTSGTGGAAGTASSKPKRLVETAPATDAGRAALTEIPRFQRLGRLSYSERVKMDVCAGSSEFGIKTVFQVLASRFSFFGAPKDRVSPWFVKTALNEYYEQLERLVTSMRLMFPRNNVELGRKLQAESPAAFNILNVIRQWKLNVIASEISKVQSRPRAVFVRDFETMLREIYKPVYILGKLDINTDVRDALQTLYQIRFLDQTTKETEALHSKITDIVVSLRYVCFQLHRLLYPLLMKTISLYYQEYELFFIENNENYKLFLGVSEADQLTRSAEKTKRAAASEGTQETAAGDTPHDGEPPETPKEQQEKQVLYAPETKAVGRGLKLLGTLFPKAPWDDLKSFPDFYPYFSDALDIKKNGELLAPEDPVHLALILLQIIEELLYGFRFIDFHGASFSDSLNAIADDWHNAISEGVEKKYLIIINEYSHYFEHSGQEKNSTYAMNIAADIHWTRRYYFLPHYSHTPVTSPSFAKKDIVPVYQTARRLRGDLALCAAAIENANRAGGAAIDAPVNGVRNPWQPYNFQVENPLSKRLDMLLAKKQRNNASLVFFTLAVATVLDYYLCDRDSPAYATDDSILFRHTEDDKKKPVFWVEKQTGTFDLFKKSIEKLRDKK
jgi:hypothetical protein